MVAALSVTRPGACNGSNVRRTRDDQGTVNWLSSISLAAAPADPAAAVSRQARRRNAISMECRSQRSWCAVMVSNATRRARSIVGSRHQRTTSCPAGPRSCPHATGQARRAMRLWRAAGEGGYSTQLFARITCAAKAPAQRRDGGGVVSPAAEQVPARRCSRGDVLWPGRRDRFRGGDRRYRLAAEQGNRQAQYNLAVMLAKGDGVEATTKAIAWCARLLRRCLRPSNAGRFAPHRPRHRG